MKLQMDFKQLMQTLELLAVRFWLQLGSTELQNS